MKFSEVRGFNYQPSYGTNSYDNWMNFDEKKIKYELGLGKKYFPKMNTVRICFFIHWAKIVIDAIL